MVEMRVAGVRVELPTETPVLLLEETGGLQRTIPIFIAHNEAQNIGWFLDGVAFERPLTYELFTNVLELLGAVIEHVIVTELRGDTYLAELHLRVGGVAHIVSCRPSDATNLALRVGCTIYCNEELLQEKGQLIEEEDGTGIVIRRPPMPELEEGQADELVGELKEWLESIKPEDFS
jgi:bifunctional DNase/RNase